MQMNWFDIGWPFVGLGGTIVMIAIMLMTDTFRGNTAMSRWRDPVWLGWLAAPLYWLHQAEEYSLPVLGFGSYAIQENVCRNMGYPAYPDCAIPLAFYPVVNIALMWVGAPLAAYLGRRNIAIGLSFWGLIFMNGVLHVVVTVVTRDYNAGMWTGLILMVPLSVWVIYACGIRGPYSAKVIGVAFAAGILAHILLGAGYGLLKTGVIGATGLLVYSVVLGFIPVVLASLGSRFVRTDLLRPNLAQ
jgi:Protein of unknown function with HXXEE motif